MPEEMIIEEEQHEQVDSFKLLANQFVPQEQLENPNKRYCTCRQKFQFGQSMIQCERCEEWFHYECLGFLGSELDASIIEFICQKCISKEKIETIKALKEQYEQLFQYYKFPKQILYQLESVKQKKAKALENINQPIPTTIVKSNAKQVIIYIKNKKVVTRDQFRKKGKGKHWEKKKKLIVNQSQIDTQNQSQVELNKAEQIQEEIIEHNDSINEGQDEIEQEQIEEKQECILEQKEESENEQLKNEEAQNDKLVNQSDEHELSSEIQQDVFQDSEMHNDEFQKDESQQENFEQNEKKISVTIYQDK